MDCGCAPGSEKAMDWAGGAHGLVRQCFTVSVKHWRLGVCVFFLFLYSVSCRQRKELEVPTEFKVGLLQLNLEI